MRWRPFTWMLLSVACFTAAYYFWRLGDQWAAKRTAAHASQAARPSPAARHTSPAAPFQLLSQAGTLNIPPATGSATNHATHITNHLALRLSNTAKPLRELQRSDKAILLE